MGASDQQANGPATAVNDGQVAFNADNATWMVANPSGTEYVQLKLATNVPLSRIDHYNDGQYGAQSVTIKTSADGSTWQTTGTYALSITANTPVKDSLTFTPVDAQYVRLEYSSFASRSWFQVNEIQVYATTGSNQRHKTRVGFRTTRPYPTYGAAVGLDGTLTSADGVPATAGTPVNIEYSYDARSWRTLTTVKTWVSKPGYYRFTHTPSRRTYYRARFAGDSRYLSSVSDSYRRVWPLAALGKPTASKTVLRYKKKYTFKGALKPAHNETRAVKIYAYRKEHGKYVYRRSFYGKATRGATYYASIKLPYKGKWRLRVYHPTDDNRYKTYSAYRYVTVK